MRCQLPTPRRCCFCIPLRIGLLIVGYIKTILSVLYLLDDFNTLYVTLIHKKFSEHYFIILMFLFSVFNSLVDVVFQLAFLIGAHKKEYRMIRLYYRYSIYNIIAITLLFCINVGLYLNTFNLFFTWNYVTYLAHIFLWTLVIQIYLLILVRSEFLKLKDKTKFQFVNNEADAQCSANIEMSSEVDEDGDGDEMDYDKISVVDLVDQYYKVKDSKLWQKVMDAGQTTWNDDTTEQLEPVKKSCCFCIPRRVGIIILALIKLVLSLGLFIIMFNILYLSYELSYLLWFYHIITWIAISLDVIDVIISLAVIISVCVKNRSAMKMYYMYSICVFGAITVLCCVIAFISTLNIVALLIFLLIFFLGFMMQAYLIGLLKTEVIELESSEQLPLH